MYRNTLFNDAVGVSEIHGLRGQSIRAHRQILDSLNNVRVSWTPGWDLGDLKSAAQVYLLHVSARPCSRPRGIRKLAVVWLVFVRHNAPQVTSTVPRMYQRRLGCRMPSGPTLGLRCLLRTCRSTCDLFATFRLRRLLGHSCGPVHFGKAAEVACRIPSVRDGDDDTAVALWAVRRTVATKEDAALRCRPTA